MRHRMHHRHHRLATAAAAAVLQVLLAAAPVAGQELGEQRIATSMLTFLKIGVGARAVALGEAFTSIADDATAMYWNPAGLALLREKRVHFTHTDWPAEIDYENAILTIPLPSWDMGMGVHVASVRTTLDYTTEVEPLPNGRTFSYSDFLLGVGLAREFTDRFSFGFNLKYVREDLASEVGGSIIHSWAADVGTMFHLPYRGFRMTMAWSNMGPDFHPPGKYFSYPPGEDPVEVGYQAFSPASIFAFGASIEPLQHRYARLLTTVQFDHPADTAERLKMGAELWLANILALRSGWNPRADEMQFSAGFGIRGGFGNTFLNIDYAYTDGQALGRVDRFSVEMEF
jgi:hypothetical protein